MTYNGSRITALGDSDPGDMLDASLAFSKASIPVFPVWGVVPDGTGGWVCACSLGNASTDNGHKPGKHPATSHAHHDAKLIDENSARAWFVENGAKNLAIPTGNGLVVFDFDPKNGGDEVYDDWESWTGGISLPPTLICETGSGGLHLYYQIPQGTNVISRTGTLPGVDIQSGGRYVITSTSRHISGGLYHWRDPERPVSTLSAELLSWLMTRRGSFGAGNETPEDFNVRAGFTAGQRDAYANARAFQLRKAGISKERATAALRAEWEKADQPEGDTFDWSVVLEKIERVWESVEPDLPGQTAQMWAAGIFASSAGIATGAQDMPRPDAPDYMAMPEDDANTPLTGQIIDPPRGLEMMTEAGNAFRYARLFQGQALYVPELGRWMIWNGSVFAPDVLDQTLALTLAVASDIRDQVLLEVDDAHRRTGEAWAMKSESMATRTATRRGAALLPGMSVRVSDLDADPWLLSVENGTVDLRTGELRASRASDLSTRRAAVQFDADAQCPRWLAHVELVAHGDKDLMAYLQRAAGYTLTGLVSEQKFFFLHGDGQNGKNVFTETLLGMLGDYGQVAAPGLLTNADDHPTALAELRGARLVMSDETQEGRSFNDARVKMITGSNRVRARFMRQDFFEYDSTMKLWILGNAKPIVKDTSAGMWRRMQLVPFTATIPDSQRILRYEELLREEWAGVLNWCLEGLRDWMALGSVGAPEVVATAGRKYRAEEDSFGQWLADRIEACPGGRLITAMAYSDYQMWMSYQGYSSRDMLNNVHFGRSMSARGYTRSEDNTVLPNGKRGKIRFFDDVGLAGSE